MIVRIANDVLLDVLVGVIKRGLMFHPKAHAECISEIVIDNAGWDDNGI